MGLWSIHSSPSSFSSTDLGFCRALSHIHLSSLPTPSCSALLFLKYSLADGPPARLSLRSLRSGAVGAVWNQLVFSMRQPLASPHRAPLMLSTLCNLHVLQGHLASLSISLNTKLHSASESTLAPTFLSIFFTFLLLASSVACQGQRMKNQGCGSGQSSRVLQGWNQNCAIGGGGPNCWVLLHQAAQ